jgi:hypothetical protein
MTELVWDQVGDRTYEAGVDRGVLYLPEGVVVPWNGLTSVTEDRQREVKSFYMDGIKYLDHHVPGSFAGKISAFTYPEELESVLGTPEFAPGVFLHDQPVRIFQMCYRTLIGNDVEGTGHGYKLHILYNVMASPASATFDSLNESVSVKPFEWTLSGTPATMFGIRPTSHISLDSRTIDETLLDEIEDLLYGTSTTDPFLPGLVELLALVEGS